VARVAESGLERLVLIDRGEEQALDLRGVRWMGPLMLVGVAALAQGVHRRGQWLHLLDVDDEAKTYAARMGLGVIIERYDGRHCLPRRTRSGSSQTLLELSQVTRSEDAREWAQLVRARAVGRAGAAAADSLFTGLAEIGENIVLHSQTEGFVAAQTYAATGEIRFAVADTGVGLRATLSARGARSHIGALRLALVGTSRFRDGAHGYGMPTTRDLIERVGGRMLLASGAYAVAIQGGTATYRRTGFPGTIFEGSLPAVPPDAGPARGRR